MAGWEREHSVSRFEFFVYSTLHSAPNDRLNIQMETFRTDDDCVWSQNEGDIFVLGFRRLASSLVRVISRKENNVVEKSSSCLSLAAVVDAIATCHCHRSPSPSPPSVFNRKIAADTNIDDETQLRRTFFPTDGVKSHAQFLRIQSTRQE